jgi:hypothetical protein
MLFGFKRQALPSMTLEGVLGPNNRVDEAAGLRARAPEALGVAGDGRLLYSSLNAVFALRAWDEAPRRWREFDQPVSALATSPGGLVAVGLANGRLVVCDGDGQTVPGWAAPTELSSIVDCLFLSEHELVLVDNGYPPGQDFLTLAPWDEAERGRILATTPSGKGRILASGLHCPMGVSLDSRNELIVTELERARIVDMSGRVRQSGYPGYLSRLRKTSAGYAMACIARRDPLIEFLKTEKDFVAAMKAGIEPRHWMSPRVNPEFSHDFPIELGSTRLFGRIKPWAPSFSYGLVLELDDSLTPVGSAHSRADGVRHGVSDVVEWEGRLIAVSKASGELLDLGASRESA